MLENGPDIVVSDVEEFKEEELGDQSGSMISPIMPASLSLFQIGSFGSSFDCPSFSASLNSLFNLHKETLSLIEQ